MSFECLSGELILELFEYFHMNEILQSFFNLTPFINSCIFDQRQQLHLYLDREMSFFPDNYSSDRVISLHIVHDNEKEDECLNMVKQVRNNVNKL